MKQRAGILITVMLVLVAWAGAVHAAPMLLKSTSDNLKRPTQIALDAQGRLYVSDTSVNAVRIYDARGAYLKTLSVHKPLGLAVDAAGNLYVSSRKSETIDVYTPDLVFSKTLATGIITNSITIDKDGNIFVVDTRGDKVVEFDPAGNVLLTIGSTGSASGSFNSPTSLAINEATGEVFVADRQIVNVGNGPTNGARIQVFSKTGVFSRSYGTYGTQVGQIASPSGLALDKSGNLYVVDSVQGAVHILDPQTGAEKDALYSLTTPLHSPEGIVMGKNNIAYVTSYGDSRVDWYALDGYVTMEVTPAVLGFAATQFAAPAASQTIVIANTGSGTLTWSAGKDQPWLSFGGQPANVATVTGATGPASANGLSVAVDASALVAGTYRGTVTVTADYGATATVSVTLTVAPPPTLNISNGWLTFSAKAGRVPASQTVTIGVSNARPGMTWSISSDSPWLSAAPASGAAQAVAAPVAVSIDTKGMAVGSYKGLLTVAAPGAVGDGGKITVNLTITPVTKISVLTNRADARFTVSGPGVYNGMGASWSVEDVPAGDYTVTFDAVAGYKKPFAQSKALPVNGEVAFSASYVSWQELAAKKNIVVAKGPDAKNDARVRVFKPNGAPVAFDLVALDTMFGANVAVGDVDGDGAADLIVGAGIGPNNPATVRIFRAADKALITTFTPFSSLNGVNVAAGDLDGDGKAEVIVSSADNGGTVAVYSYANGKMVPTGISISGGPAVAVADTEGDGKPEIVTASGGSIKIWKVNLSGGPGAWTAAVAREIPFAATAIAAADVNADGIDEIIAATDGSNGSKSTVTVFGANGSQTSFEVFEKHGVIIAAADLDGDGNAEIIAASGRELAAMVAAAPPASLKKMGKRRDDGQGIIPVSSDQEEGVVRVYTATGVVKFVLRPFRDVNKEGVTVAVGDLGL